MSLTDDRIRELRGTVAHLDPDTINIPETAPLDDEERAAVRAYLDTATHRYAQLVIDENGDVGCLNCGARLNGLFGAFEWGIVHGEGHCAECGWPVRLYHYVEVPGRERETRVTALLQYHPDALILAEEAER